MRLLLKCLLILLAVWLIPCNVQAQGTNFSLRFFGHAVNDIDRVKIRIDAPARPADIGATSFTLEFWMKANPGENSAGNCISGNDGWIFGNIIFDRDIFGAGEFGDYGISLFSDGLAFGVASGFSGNGLCGNTNVANGQWHHIAVTRNATTGALRLYVDGQSDAAPINGPSGDVSYGDGRSTSFANDPFLVIGAEKHDAGPDFPSFSGWIDEVRLSNSIRYTTNFTPPGIFTSDANTVALYHFDEGPAGSCTGTVLDSSGATGGPSNGICRFGGSSPAGPLYTTDTPPFGSANCGDGDLDPGEQCDDGDVIDGDGCDSNCTFTGCQNGIVTAGEQCDDGNPVPGDGCEPDCTLSSAQLISGKQLLVQDRDGDSTRRKITLLSRDSTIVSPALGSSGDPTTGGAVLRLGRGTAEVATFTLPASGWRALGNPPGANGYLYTDRPHANGPCERVRIQSGRLLQALCRGDQISFSLDEPSQGSLAVTFAPGTAGLRSCLVFGGTVVQDKPAINGQMGTFKALNAPAPASCPLP